MAMKKININSRIARWSSVMQNYKFELSHRSSNKMVHIDCLTRERSDVSLTDFNEP